MPRSSLIQEDLRFARGYRSPSISATLLDDDGERYQIPTGSTIKFRMINCADDSVKVNSATAVKVQNDADPLTFGDVRYDWAALDVDTAGRYWAYFIVVLPSTLQELWPPSPELILTIEANA